MPLLPSMLAAAPDCTTAGGLADEVPSEAISASRCADAGIATAAGGDGGSLNSSAASAVLLDAVAVCCT